MRLAFTMEDASRAESDFESSDKQFKNILLDTRLDNRILDLRVRDESSALCHRTHESPS